MSDRNDTTVAFVDLLNQSRGRLFGFIHALVLNFEDAEDLYQQVVVVLWQKFDQYEPGTDFTRWAIRVADLTVKNFLRRRRRSRVLFNEEMVDRILEDQAAVEAVSVSARSDALAHCLERLPTDDRRLIELCYSSDEKLADVAKREGRTSDSLYVALHRIRRALYKCIQKAIGAEIHA